MYKIVGLLKLMWKNIRNVGKIHVCIAYKTYAAEN